MQCARLLKHVGGLLANNLASEHESQRTCQFGTHAYSMCRLGS